MNATECYRYSHVLPRNFDEYFCRRELWLACSPCPPPLDFPYTRDYFRDYIRENFTEEDTETILDRCSQTWQYADEPTTTSTPTPTSRSTPTSTSTTQTTQTQTTTTSPRVTSFNITRETTTVGMVRPITPTSNAGTVVGSIVCILVVLLLIGLTYKRRKCIKRGIDKRRRPKYDTQASTRSDVHLISKTEDSRKIFGRGESETYSYKNESYDMERDIIDGEKQAIKAPADTEVIIEAAQSDKYFISITDVNGKTGRRDSETYAETNESYEMERDILDGDEQAIKAPPNTEVIPGTSINHENTIITIKNANAPNGSHDKITHANESSESHIQANGSGISAQTMQTEKTNSTDMTMNINKEENQTTECQPNAETIIEDVSKNTSNLTTTTENPDASNDVFDKITDTNESSESQMQENNSSIDVDDVQIKITDTNGSSDSQMQENKSCIDVAHVPEIEPDKIADTNDVQIKSDKITA